MKEAAIRELRPLQHALPGRGSIAAKHSPAQALLTLLLLGLLWASSAIGQPLGPIQRGAGETTEAEPDREILEAQVQALRASLPEAGEESSEWLEQHGMILRHGSSLSLMSLGSTTLNESEEFGDA